MKTVKMNINDKEIEAIKFSTRKAAENFINKKGGEIIFFRAHEYYVNCK